MSILSRMTSAPACWIVWPAEAMHCACCRLYWAATAFVAMLLPFFGDFIALIGSVAVFPCCLIFPLMLSAIVRKKTCVNALIHGASLPSKGGASRKITWHGSCAAA